MILKQNGKKLKNTLAVAPKLKVKLRLVTITCLSLAVLVAIRVFSLLNFGTAVAVNAAEKVKPLKAIEIKKTNNLTIPDTSKVAQKGHKNIK